MNSYVAVLAFLACVFYTCNAQDTTVAAVPGDMTTAASMAPSNETTTPSGLECYSCTSATDTGCAETFDPATVKTTVFCSGQCSKNKAKLAGVEVYTRACTPSCTKGKISLLGISSETWCCDTAKCNGAGALQISQFTVFITLIVGVVVGLRK